MKMNNLAIITNKHKMHSFPFHSPLNQLFETFWLQHAGRDVKVKNNTRVAASATKLLLQAGYLGPCDLGALFDGGKPVAARQDFGLLPSPLVGRYSPETSCYPPPLSLS